jgi:small subunit ribosomal protein S21
LEIHIGEGQNLEKALRQFRRKVQRAGILADMRRKRRYEKPSEAKRRKAKAAERRQRPAPRTSLVPHQYPAGPD